MDNHSSNAMKLTRKLKTLSVIARKPGLIRPRANYIFMLSHMRSRSSLLSHILGSNEQICGYSELHNSYVKKSSLLKMHIDIYQDLGCDLNNKYLFDKLLHNSRQLSDDVINHTNARLIVLLREPVSTLKSIIRMGELVDNEKYRDQSLAFEYYCNRLTALLEYANSDYDLAFVDSGDLVKQPDKVLAQLSDWLELDQPLSQEYSIFSRTGVAKAGDPSSNIKQGKIVDTSRHDDIELDQALTAKATELYNHCKSQFVK